MNLLPKTPWSVRFETDGGYDCMYAGYDILDANGDRLLTVDVGDFISDNPTYEEKHAENATAKALADLIVQAPRLLEACTKARNVLVEIRKRI